MPNMQNVAESLNINPRTLHPLVMPQAASQNTPSVSNTVFYCITKCTEEGMAHDVAGPVPINDPTSAN